VSLIILSSSYVSNEMRCEFGEVPPCMLPLGGKLLLEHQLEFLGERDNFLSLPSDYVLNNHELKVISELKLNIIKVDGQLSLGMALQRVLEQIETLDRVTILFGDTLVKFDTLQHSNVIGISKGLGYYEWSVYDQSKATFSANTYESHENSIFNGYLSFKSKEILTVSLAASNFDFTSMLNYALETEKINLAESDLWLDFGHLNTYFESKRNFTTERAFNNLEYTNGFLYKSSENVSKLKSEALWFSNVPKDMRIYTPLVISELDDDFYKIEYINSLSLSEIYLFCRVNSHLWKRIIGSCFDFLDLCKKYEYKADSYDWDVNRKTRSRWSNISAATKNLLNPALESCNEAFDDILDSILYSSEEHEDNKSQFMHGDLCFSNILYDFRSNRIRVIDPRGCDYSGKSSIYGPADYDVAKLAHSIIGRYDEIIADRYDVGILKSEYRLVFNDQNRNSFIKTEFILQLNRHGYSLKTIYKQMIGLFISMLPLHEDSEVRQLALFVNALRLKKEMTDL